jgi:ketosteroid isomerase-like protein
MVSLFSCAPRQRAGVEGRQAAAELYRPYGATFSLDRCYDPAVHHDQVTGVVVLEYASQGRSIPTGTAYSNRYISVLSIIDRKIAHCGTTSTR